MTYRFSQAGSDQKQLGTKKRAYRDYPGGAFVGASCCFERTLFRRAPLPRR